MGCPLWVGSGEACGCVSRRHLPNPLDGCLAIELFDEGAKRFVLAPGEAEALFAVAVEVDVEALGVVPQRDLHVVVALAADVVLGERDEGGVELVALDLGLGALSHWQPPARRRWRAVRPV